MRSIYKAQKANSFSCKHDNKYLISIKVIILLTQYFHAIWSTTVMKKSLACKLRNVFMCFHWSIFSTGSKEILLHVLCIFVLSIFCQDTSFVIIMSKKYASQRSLVVMSQGGLSWMLSVNLLLRSYFFLLSFFGHFIKTACFNK